MLAATVTVLVLASDHIPLGVPGEWVWNRQSWPADIFDAMERFLPAAGIGGLLFGLACFGSEWVSDDRRLRTGLLLIALSVTGFGWMAAVQHSAAPAHRAAKPYFVLYDPAASGYFFEATFKMNSVDEFLRGYEARMREGEVLHIGTHPPGLFLLHRLAIRLCEASPTLVHALNAVESRDARQAIRQLEFPGVRPLEDHEIAALHLVSTLTTLAAALAVLPLFVLLRTFADSRTAWNMCCLWPTVPAISVFAPKSDVLFAFTTTVVLTLGVVSVVRRSALAGISAGVVLWLGLLLSLAHLPIVLVLVLFVLIRAWRFRDRRVKDDIRFAAICAGTVLVATAAWSAATGCNLLRVWQLNLTNHAGFYEQYVRTWWKWLLVNPLELGLGVGLPLTIAAVAGIVTVLRAAARSDQKSAGEAAPAADWTGTDLVVASVSTILLLWLSGKNQGEAARLWCFLMPWLLIPVAVGGSMPRAESPTPKRGREACWRWLLAAQLICGLATVSRVSGFSF
ncbi:MAG: hypothetical protein R3C19_01235 [Planctomycetaceae bacterium]